jgi:protocatechuate 3,4-dioxygenase beta subunit
VHQNGFVQTQPVDPPGTYTVQAISSTNPGGLDFGNFQLVSVIGNVYNDLNGDGIQNAGEPGLEEWEVDLINSGGDVAASVVTDAAGSYSFFNIGPGSYTLQERLQPDWVQTAPAPPGTYSFTTSSGFNVFGGFFGNRLKPEDLSGLVYNDLNGDGSDDGGTDPVLPGWTINVLDPNGDIVATTTSAADGTYSFTGLPAQPYAIQEVTQAGWTITQPTSPPGTYMIPAGAGDHTGLDFGDFQLVSVSGNVYNDENGNGQQNAGDPGLDGWTVNLVDSSNNVVASAVSDASGNYTITGVGPGSFTLQEVVQGGWIIAQPVNPSYYSLTTSSGGNVVGGIFGDFHTISVSGVVYNDIDGNGFESGAEPGLASWTVNLEDSDGNILATVLTDASGHYSITGVGPGSYQVAQVVQTGWVQTWPQYPTTYFFTTQSGGNLAGLVFGDHVSPVLSPSAVIDNGQPGYSETGTRPWNTEGGGFNGTNRVARSTFDTPNTATATWDFTGVSNTLVDVYVTFAGESDYSSAAPFTVYDGGTSLGTEPVDEAILVTQSQAPRAAGSYGGVGWLELGTFVINSGEIKVVLNIPPHVFMAVDADGVLIIAHGGNAPVRSPAVGSSSGTIAIGSAGIVSPTQPSTGTDGRTAAPTIALDGIPAPSQLTVMYDPSTQPIADPYSPSAIDAVLHRGTRALRRLVWHELWRSDKPSWQVIPEDRP